MGEFVVTIKKAFFWIFEQLDLASDVVEYVSWITAGIFAVLAIFTIFLAHQFQTNTTESVKVTEKIREAVKEKQTDGLKALFQDFQYFSRIPGIIKSSLEISVFIIYFLSGIWAVCGLAMIVHEIQKDTKSFPILGILLLTVTTLLFIAFSFKLVKTIRTITNENNNELAFKKIEEIKSFSLLSDNGFPIKNIIEIDHFHIKIDILSDEPFLYAVIERKFGFSSFSFVFNISHADFNFFLGSSINTIDNKIECEINDHLRSKLNKIFTEENLTLCIWRVCFYINDMAYSFKMNPTIIAEPLPRSINLELGTEVNWEPPVQLKNKIINGDKIEELDDRRTI